MDFAIFEIRKIRKNKMSGIKRAAGTWYLHPQNKGKISSRAKDPSGIFDIYETGATDLWMSWDGKKKYRLLSSLRSRDTSLKGEMWDAISEGDEGRMYFDSSLKRVGFNEQYPDSFKPEEDCKKGRKVCETPESYLSEFETFASLSTESVGFLEGFLLATYSI